MIRVTIVYVNGKWKILDEIKLTETIKNLGFNPDDIKINMGFEMKDIYKLRRR